MTAGDIALLLTAVTALVTAVGAIYTNRQRKAALDADELEKERNQLRARLESALRHIHDQDLVLASHGIDGPPMPDDLKLPAARSL